VLAGRAEDESVTTGTSDLIRTIRMIAPVIEKILHDPDGTDWRNHSDHLDYY
jgi:hypothetical protein